ncbi:hypothetical protein [uncultured Thiodictyon sp.]|uniref:hypothetical protein n=1 Tax=uncultured Thiodictyon sp. TaxID=1846217 RepID=UPI0025F6D0C7|nr:hypothetical protein [uncultured Thiodictyon sp.]
MEALTALAQAVYEARTQQRAHAPDVAESLAQVAGLPAPLGAFGRFLQALARHENPPPPPDLPAPLAQLAAALRDALAGGH